MEITVVKPEYKIILDNANNLLLILKKSKFIDPYISFQIIDLLNDLLIIHNISPLFADLILQYININDCVQDKTTLIKSLNVSIKYCFDKFDVKTTYLKSKPRSR
jgi:hypothetical protein